MVGKPTEAQLEKRIKAQLGWRGPTEEVAMVWRGYLAGLYEWGVIDYTIYDRLSDLLPKKGLKVLHEIFLNSPITPEQERNVEKYVGE